MSLVKRPSCDSSAVSRLIQSHVSSARLNSDVSAELSFILPQDSKASFSHLFTDLDQRKDTLGIVSYGVSVTTMEEVFVRSIAYRHLLIFYYSSDVLHIFYPLYLSISM